MLKHDVKIGGNYLIKVSGRLVPVHILRINTWCECVWSFHSGVRTKPGTRVRTHWIAKNLATGREIEIKSAAKLRQKLNLAGVRHWLEMNQMNLARRR